MAKLNCLISVIVCITALHLSVYTQPFKQPVKDWLEDINFYEKTVRAKHKNLFHFQSEAGFNQKISELKGKIDQLSDYEIIVELSKISASIGDGHTYIHTDRLRQYWLPLRIGIFDEGSFIIGASPDYEDLIGGKIIGFDEKNIQEAIDALKFTCATDLRYDEKDYFSQLPVKMMQATLLHALGIVKRQETLVIKIEKDGKPVIKELKNLELDGESFGKIPMKGSFTKEVQRPVSYQNTIKNYWFTYLPDGKAIYLAYNNSQQDEDERMDAMTERLLDEFEKNGAEKLIVDVRRNGGGNEATHKRLVKAIIGNKKINQKGKLFVLMGVRTYSAADNFVLDLENNSAVITIGEHGRGKPNHYSENYFFSLPNSKTRCSVSELYRVDGKKDDTRVRIEPMIKITNSFRDFIANRDAVLEKALLY
jgi:Peptidase family S41